jgi:hypothetical protein
MKFQPNDKDNNTRKRNNWDRVSPALPVNKDILLYPRVSRPGQLKNVSAELQAKEDGELMQMAINMGWLPESEWYPGCGRGKIRQFPQDMATSARLRMEDRKGFKLMLQAIISGEAGAVLAVDVDRLFRDKYGKESGKFIEICEYYKVIVITPTFIYDFHDPMHIKLFKDAVQRAWDYMQYQVFDRMIYHQNYLQETGRIGRGQHIGVGFILDRNEDSPTYRHLLPYPLHANVLISIYERNRELANNINALFRELRTKPFVFRDFPPDTDPRHVTALVLTKVPGGYIFADRTSLKDTLCNVVNIGWMRNGNDVVRDKNGQPMVCHTPIIPPERQDELFWYFFNAHASHLPDGIPNPNVQKWRARTDSNHVNALLRGVIKSANPSAYRITTVTPSVRNGRKQDVSQYVLYDPKNESGPGKTYMGATEVDSVYWQLLHSHLQQTKDFNDYAKLEHQATQGKEKEKVILLAQIDACDRIVEKQTKKLIKLDMDDDNKKGNQAEKEAMSVMINAIKAEIASQIQEKKRLETLLSECTDPEQQYAADMIEWSALIRDIEDIADLERYTTLAERQKIVEVFTISVTLEALSPRILRLTIHWRYPGWKSEAAIWIRESKPVQRWPKEEVERFSQLVDKVTPLELLQAFPNRSWSGLRGIQWTRKLGTLIAGTCPIPEIESSWCWQDYQLIKKFGLVSDEIKIVDADNPSFAFAN